MGKQSSQEDLPMKLLASRHVTLVIYFMSIMSFDAIGEGLNLPNIGKFRSCDFANECETNFDCNNVKRCDHIVPFKQDCKTTYKSITLALGIKTKIPEVRCNKVRNDELKKCESERALAISKCRERQTVEKNTCLKKAAKQEKQCLQVGAAEIEAGKDLELSLKNALDYLPTIDGRVQKISIKQIDSDNNIDVSLTIIHSKDYSGFWSFLYSEKKFADWEKIPSLGYSSYRTFIAIGNYLVISPDGPELPTDEMLSYTAISSILFEKLGVDGMAQLYTHQPGYIEEYLVKKLNK